MQGGKIMMSENTPITVENLATITHKSCKKIQNILNKLIHFEMIICEDNIYRIKNWDKYQSADKYEIVKNKTEKDKKDLERIKKMKITLDNGTEENKLEENKKDFSKKKSYLNYEQRDYSNFDWDSLYANFRKWGKYETILW